MNRGLKSFALVCLFSAVTIGTALAGEVVIANAEAVQQNGQWRFSVTLRHDDTGWDHYADLWQVVTPDGDILGERVLAHPHVNEQPFTRSLGGIRIPDDISKVIIRARDTVHGDAEETFEVTLTR
ncbi:hypothetical protein DYI23_03965 [Roseibium polysiphoniae]|uniref:Uncharacterized protein n=1 Tax=Roseibium polysiphoniae TaxID=2571221 RepID=A0A944CBY3_9HYPH|nr:hypothetical protein [Roseibium polysiphoniae]MBS8259368.1 hypothetical protein [Roseibium polysiphoniae]